MKCTHCGSEWTIGKSVTNLDKCPFCGKSLVSLTTGTEITMAMVLRQMVRTYGIGIFTDQRKCISAFKDIAPHLKEEQNILDYALRIGVADYFVSCPEGERDANIQKAKLVMGFLNDKAKELIVASFVEALGWNIPKTELSCVNMAKWHEQEQEMIQNTTGTVFFKTAKNDHGQTSVTKIEKVKYFERIKNEAEKGDANAEYYLAVCYETGQGTDKDEKEAFYWYWKAAEKGLAKAQYEVATCWLYGKGTWKDLSRAKFWLEKASDQGHTEAKKILHSSLLKK